MAGVPAGGYSTGETHFNERNNDVGVVVQIEDARLLEHLDEIMGLEGVDALFLGPADFSTSLGKPGKLEDEVVTRAIEKVLAAAREHDKPIFSTAFRGRGEGVYQKMFEDGFRGVCDVGDIGLVLEHGAADSYFDLASDS